MGVDMLDNRMSDYFGWEDVGSGRGLVYDVNFFNSRTNVRTTEICLEDGEIVNTAWGSYGGKVPFCNIFKNLKTLYCFNVGIANMKVFGGNF